MADVSKSVKDIIEQFALGSGGPQQGALTAGTYSPIKGLFVVNVPLGAPAAVGAAGTRTDEVTITSTSNAVRVAVGDLFVPLGAPAAEVTAITAMPAVAKTIDKAAIRWVNGSAAGITPTPALTWTFLWIKFV